MRIIAGEYRGRRIKQPDTGAARPTKDRIREAVFNVIAAETAGANVLDMFAGSGAYGLEALSRGAKSAVFVEKDRHCADVIEENIRQLGLEKKAELIVVDAENAVRSLSKRKEAFDLIFADPPFNTGMGKKTLNTVNRYDILSSTGLLAIEHHKAELVPASEGNFSILKQKTYGDIVISFFVKK